MVTRKKTRGSAKNPEEVPRGKFSESLAYLKESRGPIYFVVALFLLSSLAGFIFSDYFSFFNELLRGLNEKIEGLGWFELIWFIFQNNVTSAFFAMLLGAFIGIVPVFNAITNGSLLGYVYSLASSQGGYGVILYIVPHGIFELPAVFIALGMGIRLGMFAFAKKGTKKKEFVRRFFNSVLAFLFIVLPLLILAAIIEGTLIHFSG